MKYRFKIHAIFRARNYDIQFSCYIRRPWKTVSISGGETDHCGEAQARVVYE